MMEHRSVLLDESIEGLHIKPEGIYVDATLGRGGHSEKILELLTTGHLYGFDQDETAICETKVRLKKYNHNMTYIHRNFEYIQEELAKLGIHKVDGILFDLGVSSPQFDNASRGFSYRYDGRLDMRMNQEQDISAYEIVNTYSEQELKKIIYEYGEDKFASSIAKQIVNKRQEAWIETTFQLVDVIKSALPQKVLNKKGHPAKKTFQAIRIAVNKELEVLQNSLQQALDLIDIQGRICVITFHSLEDRIVKQQFASVCKREKVDKRVPVQDFEKEELPFQLITNKPVLADQAELNDNRRSHSAKLRIIERKR